MRQRILITSCIAVLVGSICSWYQLTFDRGAGDISWPLCAADALLSGSDPYTCSAGMNMPTNMLMTALFVLPLSKFAPALAAGVLIAASTALLVWGILRNGSAWRLTMLLAFPFWQCVQTANWTILLVAIMFSPWAYPFVLVKPHAALPVAFARFSWRGVAVVSGLMLVTFFIMPNWPLRWWATAQTYSGGPLIVAFPLAALLFVALFRWRSEHVRYYCYAQSSRYAHFTTIYCSLCCRTHRVNCCCWCYAPGERILAGPTHRASAKPPMSSSGSTYHV